MKGMSHNSPFSTVEEAIEWIHSLKMHGIKPGLKRMEWMMEQLNHPERKVKFVHIGGTNGKGSTLSFMRYVLQEAGFQVGSFTSPYIERFQNRIQVNGNDIGDQDLVAMVNQIYPLVQELSASELGTPTEFEVVTTIAILYFANLSYPDLVLWEVGLGGKLDSTNVVTPILSIITNVGHDHIHILGDKITEIAEQKAGIIKSGVPIVTGTRNEEALQVIQAKAADQKASLYVLDTQFRYKEGNHTKDQQIFSYRSAFSKLDDLAISLLGKHQLENASVAVMALEVLKQFYAIIWDEDELRRGFKDTFWMGRMEKVKERPLTILDGAHNPEGIMALRQTLKDHFQDQRITLIFSAMKDKDIPNMLKLVDGFVDKLMITQFDFPRAAKVDEVLQQIEDHDQKWNTEVCGALDWRKAYQQIVSEAHKDDVILFTGSLYFISEVRKHLKK